MIKKVNSGMFMVWFLTEQYKVRIDYYFELMIPGTNYIDVQEKRY